MLKEIKDILSYLKNEKKNLLIGNGLSISIWDKFKDHFITDEDFKDILKRKADEIGKLTNEKKSIEEILKIIKTTYNDVKDSFFNIMKDKHPNYGDIKKHLEKFAFLKKVDSIFSLNFDLLLSWYMRDNEKLFYDFFDDYKFYDIDKINQKIKVFFLHGSFNIYSRNNKIYKSKFYDKKENRKKTLSEMIKEANKYNNEPIFVLDGESKDKSAKIGNNEYLNFCYNKFKKMSDNLIIYGCSLSNQDKHIIDAINNSQISNIYYGIYTSDKINNSNKKREDEIKSYFNGKTINFFSTN